MRWAKKNPGFTLIELLLSLTLFSALMSLLLNSFFQFNDQNKKMEELLTARQEARILEQIIRQDLNSAVFLKAYVAKIPNVYQDHKSGILGEDGHSGIYDSDRIHLHVNHASRFFRSLDFSRDPEIHEVSYFLDDSEDGPPRFKRREEFYIDDDMTGGDESIVHTLSEHVVSFNVVYYQSYSQDAFDEWDSSAIDDRTKEFKGLPAGLKITLVFQTPTKVKFRSEFQVNLKPDMGTAFRWE